MTAIYRSRELANTAAEKLKVYAQPQRLMILSCLLEGERTVGEIDAVTQIGQPALSQQLAELRRTEMVVTRREAKQIWYKLADGNVSLCVRTLETIFGTTGDAQSALRSALQLDHETATAPVMTGAAKFARIL